MARIKTTLVAGHAKRKGPGACYKRGYCEAHFTPDVVERIKMILHQAGVSYRDCTKSSLGAIVACANYGESEIFVSVHFNGFTLKSACGSEVWYYPGSKNGKRLAGCIQKQLVNRLKTRNRGIKCKKGFYVLGIPIGKIGQLLFPRTAEKIEAMSRTKMPAVIVEPMFITNPVEASRIFSPAGRQQIAEAIAAGILDYFKIRYPAPTPAPPKYNLDMLGGWLSNHEDRINLIEKKLGLK